MKAQAFLKLVGEMMTAQQDYFKARKAGRLDTYNLLVNARNLEKRVMVVLDEGKLEADEPLDTAQEMCPTDEPKQSQLFE
ncbi:hypothetical protein FBQ81_03375 [Chloroflexi bacterium CFX6]|nr:hypothetical protein [Chloroflexi bacterium CFX6]